MPEGNDTAAPPEGEAQETSDPTADQQNDQGEPGGLPDDPEALRKIIADLRKENAGHRTKNRELEPLAQKARELEEASKTDLERVTGERDAERERANTLEVELARLKAAVKHGLDEDDLDLLGTGTAEEIEERAARLAARIAAQDRPDRRPDRSLGRTEESKASPDQWLRDAARR